MTEPVSAGVCRVTQSARRCLSLSTTDRHAGPPGGKVGLQLSVPPQPAERQACDSAATCFHQPHTCCLTLCYAKVFDPVVAKVRWPGGWKHNNILEKTTTFWKTQQYFGEKTTTFHKTQQQYNFNNIDCFYIKCYVFLNAVVF